jgi:hypothetical protein
LKTPDKTGVGSRLRAEKQGIYRMKRPADEARESGETITGNAISNKQPSRTN